MAVRIRLTRMGRKKAPYYRVVVADSRRARDGRVIEYIGRYQPLQPNDNLLIDEERALYWLGVGASPSDTVRSLLRRLGILRKFHENRYGPTVPAGNEKYHEKKAKVVEAPAPAPQPEPEPVVAEEAAPEAAVETAAAPEAVEATEAVEETVAPPEAAPAAPEVAEAPEAVAETTEAPEAAPAETVPETADTPPADAPAEGAEPAESAPEVAEEQQ